MSRRRRSEESGEGTMAEGVALVFVGGIAYLIWQFYTNRANFWKLAIWAVVVVILGTVATLVIRDLIVRYNRQRIEKLVKRVQSAGLEQELLNFIIRFDGERGKKEEKKIFGTKSFLKERLNLFIETLNRRDFTIDVDEFCVLLGHYIHVQDLQITAASIRTTQRTFSDLSGTDFERLLVQLYVARGYQVQPLGGVGDQGGDLIANRPGERILIQAKRYKGSVGNDAVQQAAAAKTFYDCNAAVVVTSGFFTREAVELSKKTGVLLIGKNELQKFLLDFLKESWS